MKAWQIKSEFGLNNLAKEKVELAPIGPGQVKLRMLASSMNYRDLVIVEGHYGRVVKPPVVPLSDGVGEVVEAGKDVSRFKLGDRVCPIFFPDWLTGEPREEVMKQSSALGASANGTLREFMVVDAERAVKVPDYLTPEEAACLPCAGVTAWNALMYGRPVKPGELVLVQGTGGVAIFALQFAKMLGARAVVISSSAEKLKRAQELGADFVINYRDSPEWHQELRRQLPDGVDRVIEVGGADTLNKSLKAIRLGGILALVGILSGGKATLDLPLVVMRNVRLEGITVGSRGDFEAMLAAMEKKKMRPYVGARFSFDEAPKAFELVKAGGTFGKICINR